MYRYIGNKTRLLGEITGLTRSYIGKDGTVADIMAGTGVVSEEYRRLGYRVIASDVMTYSKWHLMVQLLLDRTPPFRGIMSDIGGNGNHYRRVLDYLNSLEPIEGYFFREFSPDGLPANGTPSRKYFTSDNARKIDAIRVKLNSWVNGNCLTELEEALLKHTLIMSANEVANISGTYGYFMSKFSESSSADITLKPVQLHRGRTDHVVMQGYAEELSGSISADLCYIDPPYIKRQYAANYHILETLARGDEPEAAGKSGLRPWRDQYSNLCTKTRSKDSFARIITDMDCPIFLISYSEDGLFPIDDLCGFFSSFGRVTLKEITYRRFRSNNSPLAQAIKEYIIVLKK